MKFAVLAALVAITLPAPAFAADWVLVSETLSGTKNFIDRSSIRAMPNGHKRAWGRKYFSKPVNSEGVNGHILLEEFDCGGERHRIMDMTTLRDGQVVDMWQPPLEWSYIAPDSSGEADLNFVCYGKR